MRETTGSNHTPRQACTLQNHYSWTFMSQPLIYIISIKVYPFLCAIYNTCLIVLYSNLLYTICKRLLDIVIQI
ncbi:hypothetical protein GCM10007366_14870 [Mammaliicoccus vitulinus]|nr:hypothetical protein GCM10007366_14870 [Mammaliicoccus vitulinus]